MARPQIFIGTAGWSIPSRHASRFDAGGSHLERYAARLRCAEINSSFYRTHKRETYARWAASVPADFRFSVKLPKTITHEARLSGAAAELRTFLDGVAGLGKKLGVLLVQLPPNLAFDAGQVEAFFRLLRGLTPAAVAIEPRHASWFTAQAEDMMRDLRAARVAADPPRAEGGDRPAGWTGLKYYRLHGSPAVYRSDYDDGRLSALAEGLAERSGEAWCIFDNTVAGHALGNALALAGMLGASGVEPAGRRSVAGDANRSR